MRRPVAHSQRYARERNRHDSYQNRAAHAPRHQNRDQQHSRAARITCGSEVLPKRHKRGLIRHDNARVPETHERDEKSDARRRSVLQAIRNAIDDLLAHIRQRQNQKQQPGKKHHAERRLPRHAAPDYDRIREIRVQRHPRRERNRIVRPNAHHQRRQRRRNARREKHAFHRHSRLGKNPRIHYHHVGHGHKRRQAGQQFAATWFDFRRDEKRARASQNLR